MKIKRLIIPFITMILLANTLAYAQVNTFPDINGTEWYYNDLMYLAERDIINGTSDGSFNASGLLTKDALIKTLVVAKGYNPGNADGYWAQNYIDKANELGWLDNTLEAPYNTSINRYETCALIVNALDASEKIPYNLDDYKPYISDYESIPNQYKDVVLKVYSIGIITGYSDKSFGGSNTLTRAEMTAILSRFINPDNRKVPMDPFEITKVSNLSEDIKVFDPLFVTFDGQQILYTDSRTNTQKSINNTGLLPNVGRISEDIFIDMAYLIQDTTTYNLITSYSYNNFYMYVENEGIIQYTYSATDGSNTLQLSIDNLYEDPYLEVETAINQALLITLRHVDTSDYEAMLNFIKDNYQAVTDVNTVKKSQTFTNTKVDIEVNQGGYFVTLTLN